ncbi:hypothetical protein [Streptomyces sp. NY05-11A]|uniref:hypothetical protein n=1 Tax=Streptomyces soliscabiei TaxID=588897 RepID=UPI003B99D606
MRTTTLGAGTVKVTQLALGCAGLGNLYQPVTDETERRRHPGPGRRAGRRTR